MNHKEGQLYSVRHGRVVNTSTHQTGNLVEWPRGQHCKVFLGYEWIGAYQSPKFDRWLKADTEKEAA